MINPVKIISSTAFIFFLMSNSIFCQDIITLRTGDEIKAIVSEIDKDIIKYKKYENQTGPVYSLEKKDVFMIRYEGGTKEVFDIPSETSGQADNIVGTNPSGGKVLAYRKPAAITENNELLTREEVRKYLTKVPEALKSYNKGLKLLKVGNVMVGMSLVTSLGFGILVKDPSLTASIVAVSVSGTGLIGSIATTISGRKKIKRAVEIYNGNSEIKP